jgi:Ca2+-binding EF-hand superfamily protein
MKNANDPGVKTPLCLLALLLPCSALAETSAAEISRHQMEEEFRALDLNGDGYVSSAEAAGFRDIVTRFDKADRNRDGKLSRAEFFRLKSMKPANSAAGGTARRPAKKAAN